MGNNQLPSLDYDTQAAKSFRIRFKNGVMQAQFPPKITSDGKTARWDEKHHYGWEEFAQWHGANARQVSIDLEYVVFGEWDAQKIYEQVLKAKGHLYVGSDTPGAVLDKVPFFHIAGYKIIDGSGETPTFRLMDVKVAYSKELVVDGDNTYPLHTKVTLNAKLFTLGGGVPRDKGRLRTDSYESGTLRVFPRPTWL